MLYQWIVGRVGSRYLLCIISPGCSLRQKVKAGTDRYLQYTILCILLYVGADHVHTSLMS